MTEYIDVAAAREFVEASYQGDPLLRHLYGTLLDKLPRVEAVEVVHGRWVKRGNETKCSVCKFIYYSNKDNFNYCPNCGAKMDGERKDND